MPECEPLPTMPPWSEIALGYALPGHRQAWATLFQIDLKLGAIVAQVREPLLSQIKLVWWRDQLEASPDRRPIGEPLLMAASQSLPRVGAGLAGLATAWECLLDEAPLTPERLREHCELRAAGYAAVSGELGPAGAEEHALTHATWWTLGDAMARTGDSAERAALHRLAEDCGAPAPLPRALRPLAVLSALGRRAIHRNEPVLEGRVSALIALRVGMFGR